MDFYWNVFTKSGSIEAYMGHKEYIKLKETEEEKLSYECGIGKRSCDK